MFCLLLGVFEMKKSLIALAVLAASGASFAQSTVTAYGLLDIAFGVNKAADGVTATSTTSNNILVSGGVDGSRWGLQGSEDLGGGLKANFKLEQGFNLDSGSATAGQAFARYSYVGFSGGFGEVKLGKTGTAYDEATSGANAVFNSALSAEANTWKSNAVYNWNPANTVIYFTPTVSGFSGAVSYSLGENKTATVDAGSITAFNVTYTGGPIYAALAYQTEKANGSATSVNFTQVNATYDFGAAKLGAEFGKVTQDGTAPTNEFQFGVTVPVSTALAVSANYAQSKDDAFNGANEVKRSGFGLGVAYTLSKRTFVYGGYRGETNNQGGAGDLSTSLFAFGVHHTF